MPLSQVLAYNTEHLIDASAHWQALADQREEVFGTVQNEACILPWEGMGADALHQRTSADYTTAWNSAENLRQAAGIARSGASTLDQMHSRVLYTIEDAQADGFAATEDCRRRAPVVESCCGGATAAAGADIRGSTQIAGCGLVYA